jgi:hypothetical protein
VIEIVKRTNVVCFEKVARPRSIVTRPHR